MFCFNYAIYSFIIHIAFDCPIKECVHILIFICYCARKPYVSLFQLNLKNKNVLCNHETHVRDDILVVCFILLQFKQKYYFLSLKKNLVTIPEKTITLNYRIVHCHVSCRLTAKSKLILLSITAIV